MCSSHFNLHFDSNIYAVTQYDLLFNCVKHEVHVSIYECSFPLFRDHPNFCHHQVLVSVTVYNPEWSDIIFWQIGEDIQCTWCLNDQTSSTLDDLSARIWLIWLWVFPSGDVQIYFMNVAMWEHHKFDCEIFRYGKFYCSNSIIIANFV
jgi:hypothetical protein